MPIVVECPRCLTPLKADERLIGSATPCPKCGTKVAIEPPPKPPASAQATGAAVSAVAGVVIVCTAAALFAAVVAVGLAALFLTARTSVVAAGPPVATRTVQLVPVAVESTDGAAAVYQAPAIGEDGTVSFPMPANPQRLTVQFPAEPSAFDPLQDPQFQGDEGIVAREVAAGLFGAADSDWYRASSGDATYTASAAPLVVGVEANDAFFDVLKATIEGIHPGFSKTSEAMLMLKAPEGASLPFSDFPGYQFRLESEDRVRIVRVVPVDRTVVSLTVERPKSLADDDAAANAFFDSLGIDGKKIGVSSIRSAEVSAPTPSAESPAP